MQPDADENGLEITENLASVPGQTIYNFRRLLAIFQKLFRPFYH